MKTASTEREAIVAGIVAGLTVAEEAAILRTKPGCNYLYGDLHGIPRVALFRKGVLRKADGPDAEYRFELTELGLAIRDHLKDQDHGRA